MTNRRYTRRKRNYEKFYETLLNNDFDDDDLDFLLSISTDVSLLFENTLEENLKSVFVSKCKFCKLVESFNENTTTETCIQLIEKSTKKMTDVLYSEKGYGMPHEPFVKYHKEKEAFEIGFNLDIWDFLLWCLKDQGGIFIFKNLL